MPGRRTADRTGRHGGARTTRGHPGHAEAGRSRTGLRQAVVAIMAGPQGDELAAIGAGDQVQAGAATSQRTMLGGGQDYAIDQVNAVKRGKLGSADVVQIAIGAGSDRAGATQVACGQGASHQTASAHHGHKAHRPGCGSVRPQPQRAPLRGLPMAQRMPARSSMRPMTINSASVPETGQITASTSASREVKTRERSAQETIASIAKAPAR